MLSSLRKKPGPESDLSIRKGPFSDLSSQASDDSPEADTQEEVLHLGRGRTMGFGRKAARSRSRGPRPPFSSPGQKAPFTGKAALESFALSSSGPHACGHPHLPTLWEFLSAGL